MPEIKHVKLPVWLPRRVLLIAMSSIQAGASHSEIVISSCRRAGRNGAALRLGVGNAYHIAFSNHGVCVCQEQRLPLLFYGLSLGG